LTGLLGIYLLTFSIERHDAFCGYKEKLRIARHKHLRPHGHKAITGVTSTTASGKTGVDLPKGWTESKLKREHSRCVKALLDEYNGFHAMRDELDDSLEQNTGRRNRKGGDSMSKQGELELDKPIEIDIETPDEALGEDMPKWSLKNKATDRGSRRAC